MFFSLLGTDSCLDPKAAGACSLVSFSMLIKHVFLFLNETLTLKLQGEEVTSKAKLTARVDISSSHEGGTTVPLLTGEVVMRVNVSERPGKSCSPLLIKTGFSSRPLIFAVTAATVCIGLCAVLFHPETVGEVATTIRKCLQQNS